MEHPCLGDELKNIMVIEAEYYCLTITDNKYSLPISVDYMYIGKGLNAQKT